MDSLLSGTCATSCGEPRFNKPSLLNHEHSPVALGAASTRIEFDSGTTAITSSRLKRPRSDRASEDMRGACPCICARSEANAGQEEHDLAPACSVNDLLTHKFPGFETRQSEGHRFEHRAVEGGGGKTGIEVHMCQRLSANVLRH